MVRIRNAPGYPSTAYGRARRLGAARVQKGRRLDAIAESRIRAQGMQGVARTGGFYGRFQGPSGELKFFDTALAFLVDATGEVPATGQLALIPQGVTQSTRVGRKATVKSIQVRAQLTDLPAAAAVAATTIYLYLMQDTQCNGAAAAVTDVLTSSDFAQGMVNMANSSRFKILKRWVMDFNAAAGVATAFNRTAKHIEFYKRCNIPLEFSSTTGAITELRSNNLFLMAGTGGGASDDTVSLTGTCRLRYSDQ